MKGGIVCLAREADRGQVDGLLLLEAAGACGCLADEMEVCDAV